MGQRIWGLKDSWRIAQKCFFSPLMGWETVEFLLGQLLPKLQVPYIFGFTAQNNASLSPHMPDSGPA